MTEDIKRQLKEFREKKRQEQNAVKQSSKLGLSIFKQSTENSSSNLPPKEEVVEQVENLNESDVRRSLTEKLQYFLFCLLIWLLIYVAALQFQFGIVFVIATGFYLLWISLGTKKRKNPNELSAYSVFNPNCERLLGQTTAEQFENEILRRPL